MPRTSTKIDVTKLDIENCTDKAQLKAADLEIDKLDKTIESLAKQVAKAKELKKQGESIQNRIYKRLAELSSN